MSKTKIKKKWIILGTTITTILLVGTGIGLFFYFDNKKTEQAKPNPPTHMPTNGINNFKSLRLVDEKPSWANAVSPSLKLTMVDVGQADSILLQMSPTTSFANTKDNDVYNVLIDSGDFKKSTSSGLTNTPNYSQHLKSFLTEIFKPKNNSEIKDTIDFFIFSHSDADHIGGADVVMKDFHNKGSKVLTFGASTTDSKTWKDTLQTVADLNLEYIDPFISQAMSKSNIFKDTMGAKYFDKTANTWDTTKLFTIKPNDKLIEFAENHWINFLVPSYSYNNNLIAPNTSSLNNFIMWGKQRILFTGDSEGKTQDDLITTMKKFSKDYLDNSNNIIPLDILKVTHHGSTTEGSNTESFLKAVTNEKTKMLISQNDNKLYSGTPTFKDTFMNNWINAVTPLDKTLFSTQELGDTTFTIHNDITTIATNFWRINNSEFSKNPSKVFENLKFQKYFYK